jgi:adenylylsulfate kinase
MTRPLWITGLPAAGKTTLALRICTALQGRGVRATLVDSDEVRAAITPEATYSPSERMLVYRSIAYLAQRLAHEGIVPVVAATAHEERLRRAIRAIAPETCFVFASCPLEICERRDPRGLYAEARERAARIGDSTLPGIGARYEIPRDADFVIDTSAFVPNAGIEHLLDGFVGARIYHAHA